MAALDLTNIAAAGSLVTERTGGLAPSDLDNLLEESAATYTDDADAEVTIYRPWYVAARLLDEQLNTKRLQSAAGAVFDNPQVAIRGLMRQQVAFDTKHADLYDDYEVPAGYEASTGTSFQVVF